MFCVAGSPDGELVASACIVRQLLEELMWFGCDVLVLLQASKHEYAAIWIWSTAEWRPVQTLIHHNLTVTQLAFSHSSELLLAVSRDRTWSLWRQDKEEKGTAETNNLSPVVRVARLHVQLASNHPGVAPTLLQWSVAAKTAPTAS